MHFNATTSNVTFTYDGSTFTLPPGGRIDFPREYSLTVFTGPETTYVQSHDLHKPFLEGMALAIPFLSFFFLIRLTRLLRQGGHDL